MNLEERLKWKMNELKKEEEENKDDEICRVCFIAGIEYALKWINIEKKKGESND